MDPNAPPLPPGLPPPPPPPLFSAAPSNFQPPPPPPPLPPPPPPMYHRHDPAYHYDPAYHHDPAYANHPYHEASYDGYYESHGYGGHPHQYYDQQFYYNNAHYYDQYPAQYSEAASTSARTDHYSQSNSNLEGDEIGDGNNDFVKQNDVVINEVDDSDDWRWCNVCGTSFDDEKAYNRHCRGLNHTQKILEREQKAGLIESEPMPEPEPFDDSFERKNTRDPNKRNLFPSDVGRPTMDERWFCKHCTCWCSGQDAFEAHLKGKRHAKTLKSKVAAGIPVDLPSNQPRLNVKAKGVVIDAIETGDRAVIQDEINRRSEPLIGLQYIVEYISPVSTEPRYICNLCEAKCDPRTVFSHLIGYKHRLQYFKEIRSDIYAEIQLCADNKDGQAELLANRASEIEAIDGRPLIVQRSEIVQNLNLDSQGFQSLSKGKSDMLFFKKDFNHSMSKNHARHERNAPKRPPSPPRRHHERTMNNSNSKRKRSRSPDARSDMSLSDDERRTTLGSTPGTSGISSKRKDLYDDGEGKQQDDLSEQGYYYRERNYNAYDERYVKPFAKDLKTVAVSATTSTNSDQVLNAAPPTNTLKTLLIALAHASMNAGPNDKEALKVSTLLTNAIIKVKQQRLVTATGTTQASPTPVSAQDSTKPKLGSGYFQ